MLWKSFCAASKIRVKWNRATRNRVSRGIPVLNICLDKPKSNWVRQWVRLNCMTKHINSVIPIVKMKKNSQTGRKIFQWLKAFFLLLRGWKTLHHTRKFSMSSKLFNWKCEGSPHIVRPPITKQTQCSKFFKIMLLFFKWCYL